MQVMEIQQHGRAGDINCENGEWWITPASYAVFGIR